MPKKTDDKTIGITIRFFTNDLPGRVGGNNRHIPCWSIGNVHMISNPTKGIRACDEKFYYIEDIPRAIKEVMKKSKMVLVEDVGYTERAKKRNDNK